MPETKYVVLLKCGASQMEVVADSVLVRAGSLEFNEVIFSRGDRVVAHFFSGEVAGFWVAV